MSPQSATTFRGCSAESMWGELARRSFDERPKLNITRARFAGFAHHLEGLPSAARWPCAFPPFAMGQKPELRLSRAEDIAEGLTGTYMTACHEGA